MKVTEVANALRGMGFCAPRRVAKKSTGFALGDGVGVEVNSEFMQAGALITRKGIWFGPRRKDLVSLAIDLGIACSLARKASREHFVAATIEELRDHLTLLVQMGRGKYVLECYDHKTNRLQGIRVQLAPDVVQCYLFEPSGPFGSFTTSRSSDGIL